MKYGISACLHPAGTPQMCIVAVHKDIQAHSNNNNNDVAAPERESKCYLASNFSSSIPRVGATLRSKRWCADAKRDCGSVVAVLEWESQLQLSLDQHKQEISKDNLSGI